MSTLLLLLPQHCLLHKSFGSSRMRRIACRLMRANRCHQSVCAACFDGAAVRRLDLKRLYAFARFSNTYHFATYQLWIFHTLTHSGTAMYEVHSTSVYIYEYVHTASTCCTTPSSICAVYMADCVVTYQGSKYRNVAIVPRICWLNISKCLNRSKPY